jgi:hypothetical protein
MLAIDDDITLTTVYDCPHDTEHLQHHRPLPQEVPGR